MSSEAPVLECVPNFSEGRDSEVLSRIEGAIASVDGVRLLGVDPGRAAHRTVMTFVGPPEATVEAAFRAIARATRLIDMRRHLGTHPRLGATDVCPLVPVAGVSLDEAAEYARRLGERVGRELDIPVYLYEHAATDSRRRNLADIRRGEYEGLADKLERPEWKPDFGPAQSRPRSGATVIGARDFLVAFNVNLDSKSIPLARAIAREVREKGGGSGSLKGVKAIGWYIEDYGIAQVSMNLTDTGATPVHVAFEEVRRRAEARGARVTGSELVGLIPLRALLEVGRGSSGRSPDVPEDELVRSAVNFLGLDDLGAFDPSKKVLEYRLRQGFK